MKIPSSDTVTLTGRRRPARVKAACCVGTGGAEPSINVALPNRSLRATLGRLLAQLGESAAVRSRCPPPIA